MIAAALLQTLQSEVDPSLLDFGYRISLVGMITVFSGLVILALSLPLIRRMAEGKKTAPELTIAPEAQAELTREEVVAITSAIHVHISQINRLADMQLTWEMYEKPYSPWRLAGRAGVLTDRSAFRHRNRSR